MSLKPVPFKILGFSLFKKKKKKKDKLRKLTSFEERICIHPQILPGHKIGNVFSSKNMFLLGIGCFFQKLMVKERTEID